MSKWGIVAIAAVLLTTQACGGGASGAKSEPKAPTTFTVTGVMDLTQIALNEDRKWPQKGDDCVGQDGYDDMQPGAEVLIRDADGTKIAFGALEAGEMASQTVCRFPFTVEGVPVGGSVYSVEVSHRGEISFKQEDAGNLSLTLG